MKKGEGFNLGRFIVSLALPFIAGGIGSGATFSQITGWYANLNKPGWNPPNEIFGPVWTFLYITIGVATYYFWQQAKKAELKRGMTILVAQLFFNALWSIVFFGQENLTGGLAVIIILWLLIVWNIIEFWRVNKSTGAILLPYLLWVSFASVLNYAVAAIN